MNLPKEPRDSQKLGALAESYDGTVHCAAKEDNYFLSVFIRLGMFWLTSPRGYPDPTLSDFIQGEEVSLSYYAAMMLRHGKTYGGLKREYIQHLDHCLACQLSSQPTEAIH